MIRAARTAFILYVGISCVVVLPACVTVLRAAESSQQDDAGQSAQQILKATGVAGGLIVHLGCGDGRLTAALYAGDSYLVHGLDADVANVQKAREYIKSEGLYGSVSVAKYNGETLPYGDNIVKLKGRPFIEGVDPSGPFYGAGFKEGYAPQIKDKLNPISDIIAIDPQSGKQLWAIKNVANYTAGSLSIKGNYAVYQAAGGLFCINAKTGKSIWSKEKKIVNAVGHDSQTPGTMPNTVVITDERVFAVESIPTRSIAANAKNTVYAYVTGNLCGQSMWSKPILSPPSTRSRRFRAKQTACRRPPTCRQRPAGCRACTRISSCRWPGRLP